MRKTSLGFFLAGIGSALEVYPIPHLQPIGRQFSGMTDAQRLLSDWNRVGQALCSAIDSSGMEHSAGAKETEPTATR